MCKQSMCGPIIESTVAYPYLFFLLLFFFSLFLSHFSPSSTCWLLFPTIYSFLSAFSHQYSIFLGHNPMFYPLHKQTPSFFLVHLGSTISSTCVFHPHAKPTQVWHRSCRKSHTNSLSLKHFQIQRAGITKQAFGKRHLANSVQHHLSDLERVTSVSTFHQGFIGPSSKRKIRP